MHIKGKHVVLRAIETEDLPLLHRWANDPEIQSQLGGWHFPSSFADQQNWYSKLEVNSLNQRFAIDIPGHGLIGTANLVDIDWKNKHAFHGMMIGDKEIRGKGYGIDTIMAVMRYAFDELGLERLDGSMISFNEISLNIYLNKCGWKEEGRQRNWYYRNGRFWDRIIVGVIKADYEQLIQNTRYWET